MPVIRDPSVKSAIPAKRRDELTEILTGELNGKSVPDGPVVFEIPLEQSTLIDVLVVWQAWQDVSSEDRTNIIAACYGDKRALISQALGVTYEEAIQQDLLPYAVIPTVLGSDTSDHVKIKEAMLAAGGIAVRDKVDLRFPTMSMARNAHRQLAQQLPTGYWSIMQVSEPNLFPMFV